MQARDVITWTKGELEEMKATEQKGLGAKQEKLC